MIQTSNATTSARFSPGALSVPMRIAARSSCFAIALAMLSTPVFAQAFGNLLSGDSFEGWTVMGGNSSFSVADGIVTGTTNAIGPNTFLVSPGSYTDFALTFETRIEGSQNSGVQFRSINTRGRVRGYQVDIDSRDNLEGRRRSARFFEEGQGHLTFHDGPEFADLRDSFNYVTDFEDPEDGWNEIKLIASGSTLQTFFNGFAGLPYTETRTPGSVDNIYPVESGFLGLQVHSGNPNGLRVQWRNFSISRVPEPNTLLITILGAGGMALLRRRNRAQSVLNFEVR